MHSCINSCLGFARTAAIALLCLAAPVLSSGQDAAAEPAAPVEDRSAEHKTLDVDLARLVGLFEQYNDPVHKLTILGYINLMKGRAEALKENWDQVKYEELRYDINLQCQRLANWLAPLRTPPPSPQGEAARQLAVGKLNPSPANPAEIKAALDAADREIRRQEDRASGLVIGSPAREAEAARIKRIKENRAALSQEFTKARWNALVADLQ